MSTNLWIILAGAVLTYLTRIGGHLVLSRFERVHPRVEAGLNAVPAAVLTTLVAPALLVGMAVGLVISFFQTVTSLQEQTLTIVPKMLAVVATLLLIMPWVLGTLREFTADLFTNLAAFGRG